jgi:hypothetical protein
MTNLKRLVLIVLVAIAFGGCQKELNFDGVSFGVLKATLSGVCSPNTFNGIYQEDSTITTGDNWIDVQVNATFGGTYEIKSDTVNGFSFYRAGAIPTGLSTIRLLASGRPDTALPTTFHLYYDSSFCTFTINVVRSTAGGAHYDIGSGGGCSSFTAFGNYNVATALDATDSVTFLANVNSTGTYTIKTDTINGISFSAMGVFNNTGVTQVTLHGSGTPVTASPPAYTFTVAGDGNTCTFPITVMPAGTGSAVFSYTATTGNCSVLSVNGTYTAGTAMNNSNTVTLNVNVATAGTYNITTTNGNNVTFSRTGTFTATGPQTVTLIASTTIPPAAGTFSFAPSAGTNTCAFDVIFGGVVPPTNLEYVPETVGTNWTDSLDGGASSDTTYNFVSSNTVSVGGNTYKKFYLVDFDHSTFIDDSTYHRSSLGKYYIYLYGTLGLDNPINKQMMILDSTLSAGGTWSTNLGANSITVGGIPIPISSLTVDAQILSKGTTEVVLGNTYTNVIKVLYKYYADAGGGPTEFAESEIWYAKGKGIIYDKEDDLLTPATYLYLTKRVQVF